MDIIILVIVILNLLSIVGINIFFYFYYKKETEKAKQYFDTILKEQIIYNFQILSGSENKTRKQLQEGKTSLEEQLKTITLGQLALTKTVKELKIKNDQQLETMQFIPYLALVEKDCYIYDMEGNDAGTLDRGEYVTIVFEDQGYGITLSGNKVNLDNISPAQEENAVPRAAVILQDCFILNGPGQGYHGTTRIVRGGKVQVVDVIGNWAKVQYGKDKYGYVLLSNISQG